MKIESRDELLEYLDGQDKDIIDAAVEQFGAGLDDGLAVSSVGVDNFISSIEVEDGE